MQNVPHTESRDGFTLQWQKCCCGVKCWATKTGSSDEPVSVGEYPFQETYEATANRFGAAAVVRAKELLP